MTMPMHDTLLSMRNVSKTFVGAKVLKSVQFDLTEGEVHALVGENGAGKSTLAKIICGVHRKDQGEVLFKGADGLLAPLELESVRHAQTIGIGIVHQEMPLNDNLSIAENIYLGREPTRLGGAMLDWKEMYRRSSQYCAEVGLNVNPRVRVASLSIGQKQQLEVAKCLALNSRLIIFDEPTTALTIREASVLFRLIGELKEKGISIIYISHKLEEVFSLSDRITVLRDGQYIDTVETGKVDRNLIIKLMVGREMNLYDFEQTGSNRSSETVLEVSDLSGGPLLRDVSFTLQRNEILGFFGLLGAGRTELARALFGIDGYQSGTVTLHGRRARFRGPGDAIAAGIAYVPEDRRREGLVLGMSVKANVVLALLRRLSRVLLGNRAESDVTRRYVSSLSVTSRDILQPVRELSGGNQQKVLIAKWLSMKPSIFIFDEPTRGIDVKSKSEIHGLLRELARDGISIIVISSEIEEILNLASRVVVMHEGRITLTAPREGLTSERIMDAALGKRG